MGCDIHLYAERNWFPGEWELGVDAETLDQNYTLFAALAGVRADSDRPAGFAPRGLPENLSEYVRAAVDEDNGHTPSWLTIEEAQTLVGISDRFDALLAYIAAVTKWDERWRLVFWFDS